MPFINYSNDSKAKEEAEKKAAEEKAEAEAKVSPSYWIFQPTSSHFSSIDHGAPSFFWFYVGYIRSREKGRRIYLNLYCTSFTVCPIDLTFISLVFIQKSEETKEQAAEADTQTAPTTDKSKEDAEAELVAQAQCCIIL